MKTSTLTYRLVNTYGTEKAVRMICEAGFDCIDHTLFSGVDGRLYLEEEGYFDKLHKMREIAKTYGVSFNQTHAPFASFKEGDDEYNEWVRPLLFKSIEASGILGAKYMVVHPFYVSADKKKANIEFFSSMLPYAEKHNVRLALENMFGWDPKKDILIKNVCSDAEELGDYVDSLDSEYAVACLDVGHCGLVGENAADMIKKLGNRLKCLHVHDNDNITDLHTIPFSQKLNFVEIMNALHDIDYDGELTLEADNFFTGFPEVLFDDVLTLLSKTARCLANM
ncbi:MAG: sugar phosphate isomerase/epimerase [Bacteroidales bacterium]|nr:sugar phosphate isomerase/epimerase [Bacteroidales bacterium]